MNATHEVYRLVRRNRADHRATCRPYDFGRAGGDHGPHGSHNRARGRRRSRVKLAAYCRQPLTG